MTPARPPLEAPEPGECCPRCREPLAIVDFCGACGWRAPAAAAAQIREATLRARAWQLGRAERRRRDEPGLVGAMAQDRREDRESIPMVAGLKEE